MAFCRESALLLQVLDPVTRLEREIAEPRDAQARAAASLFRVSVSYVYKAAIRRRRTGQTSASSNRGHRPRKLTPEQELALADHVRAHSDMTLATMQAWLEAEHGVRLSSGAIWRVIDRAGLSFKKRRLGRASKTVRTSRRADGSGKESSPTSIQIVSSLSMRPEPTPR